MSGVDVTVTDAAGLAGPGIIKGDFLIVAFRHHATSEGGELEFPMGTQWYIGDAPARGLSVQPGRFTQGAPCTDDPRDAEIADLKSALLPFGEFYRQRRKTGTHRGALLKMTARSLVFKRAHRLTDGFIAQGPSQ